MKYGILLLVILVIASCCRIPSSTHQRNSTSYRVKYHGALRDIMHRGDISAKANLSDFKAVKHLYAIGALEHLKGEIQILDSHPYNSRLVDSTLRLDHSYNAKATLLVYAVVPKWQELEIPGNVRTYEQLEEFIGMAAAENHIDVNQPFPFMLEGTPRSFDWHVINWKAGDREHSHEKHIHSGLHGTQVQTAVVMLGFYSDRHHAIFTHHTTNMHIHVKAIDDSIAGHVDDLLLGPGMTLKLPYSL